MGRSFIHLFLTIALILGLCLFGKIKQYFLLYPSKNIIIKEITTQYNDSIIVQNDSVIIPVNYIGSVDFRIFDSESRKKKFIDYLLPSILIIRERLIDDLHHIEFIENKIKLKKRIYPKDSTFLSDMKLKYRSEAIYELKRRIFPHPVSLALTQAILESGWGTSMIARKGNNLFGVLSFSTDDSRLKMQFDESENDVYLRIYKDVIESVEHYYLLISRVSSYEKFRQKRWEGATSLELIKLLDNYHESDEYEFLAKSIISNNNLSRFDDAVLAPNYFSHNSLSEFLTKR